MQRPGHFKGCDIQRVQKSNYSYNLLHHSAAQRDWIIGTSRMQIAKTRRHAVTAVEWAPAWQSLRVPIGKRFLRQLLMPRQSALRAWWTYGSLNRSDFFLLMFVLEYCGIGRFSSGYVTPLRAASCLKYSCALAQRSINIDWHKQMVWNGVTLVLF